MEFQTNLHNFARYLVVETEKKKKKKKKEKKEEKEEKEEEQGKGGGFLGFFGRHESLGVDAPKGPIVILSGNNKAFELITFYGAIR